MNDPTLVDRYVAAAMRTVPVKARADLAAELRASIDDQIDARTKAGEAQDAAERAALQGLGDPEKLAAGYTDRPLHLVGPRYYLAWWRLVKVLLWSVLPAVGGAVALGLVIAGEPVGTVIGTLVVTVQLVALHVLFWTTLIFMIIERSEAEAPGLALWTPDRLPEPPAQGAGRGDVIATLVFLGVGAGVILWDRVVGFVLVPDGPLPLLNPALWPWWIAGLFTVMAAEAVVILAVRRARRWTITLATIQTMLGVVLAVAAIWLLHTGELANPAWPAVVGADIDAEARRVLPILTGFVIAGITVWGAIDAYRKALAARRRV